MTPRKNSGVYFNEWHGVEKQRRIYAYVEAVNYLLNSYTTDVVIPKEATEIEAFK